MLKFILFSSALFMLVVLPSSMDAAFAHPHFDQVMINDHTHNPQTQNIPLNDMMKLQTATIPFHSPQENKLPWAFVEGNVPNHVKGYPVIIQIFKDIVQFTLLKQM